MSKKILILGRSGSGKSTSLRNFKKGEVGIISCEGKEMPFRTDIPVYEPKFTPETMNRYPNTLKAIKNAKTKVLVIDDANYLMSTEFMATAGEKGYDKFTRMASNFTTLLDEVDKLDDDITVYIMMHTELDADGYERPMTVGKLLSEKVCIEGLFTTVLKSVYEGGEYKFRTKTNGADCIKSPLGLFQSEMIDNDLKAVDVAIRDYYGMPIPYDLKKGEDK